MTDLVMASLPDRMEYSKALAASDLLPKQYRGHPANVLVAVEYGAALGLSPMAAIQGIHVVEGKPTASAQLIGALVRNAGHKLRVTGTDEGAVAVIVRRDDPDYEFRAEWTMERAKRAGLAGKAVWKQYPTAMLKARAITEVARDACPEVLSGVAYTPEELEPSPAPVARASAARLVPPSPAAAPPVDMETGEILDGEVVEDAPPVDEPVDAEIVDEPSEPLRTDAQSKKLFALLRKLGIADRDAALQMIGDILAVPVESTKDLTREQASMVIDTLSQMAEQGEDA